MHVRRALSEVEEPILRDHPIDQLENRPSRVARTMRHHQCPDDHARAHGDNQTQGRSTRRGHVDAKREGHGSEDHEPEHLAEHVLQQDRLEMNAEHDE